jgi:drug/metabolite transporter (DMT)-like permease
MLDNLLAVCGVVCILIGSFLLHQGFDGINADQTSQVIIGSVILALGLIAAWIVLKNKLEFWRDYKKHRT